MMISCLASLVRASTHEDPSRDHQLDVEAGRAHSNQLNVESI